MDRLKSMCKLCVLPMVNDGTIESQRHVCLKVFEASIMAPACCPGLSVAAALQRHSQYFVSENERKCIPSTESTSAMFYPEIPINIVVSSAPNECQVEPTTTINTVNQQPYRCKKTCERPSSILILEGVSSPLHRVASSVETVEF
jgi:hypothetical protein